MKPSAGLPIFGGLVMAIFGTFISIGAFNSKTMSFFSLSSYSCASSYYYSFYLLDISSVAAGKNVCNFFTG